MLEAFGVVIELYRNSKPLNDADLKTQPAVDKEAEKTKRLNSIQSERLFKKFAGKFKTN